MAIVRRLRLAGTVALLCLLASVAVASPALDPAHRQSQTGTSIGHPHEELAYSLPPDKLAQAIALNKIRVWLNIGGSLWGLMVVWGVLAFGTAARLDEWTRETTKTRWLQGALFFAIVLAILAIANLPLDALGHAASLRYGISVQSWPGWMGDEGKGLGVSLLIGVPLALLCNWIVRVSPRRYWLWLWILSMPLIVTAVFLAPMVLDPIFNTFEPLQKTHPALARGFHQLDRFAAGMADDERRAGVLERCGQHFDGRRHS